MMIMARRGLKGSSQKSENSVVIHIVPTLYADIFNVDHKRKNIKNLPCIDSKYIKSMPPVL